MGKRPLPILQRHQQSPGVLSGRELLQVLAMRMAPLQGDPRQAIRHGPRAVEWCFAPIRRSILSKQPTYRTKEKAVSPASLWNRHTHNFSQAISGTAGV